MASQISKLISAIDQLLIWLRANPATPVPSREEERLKTIVDQLTKRTEITDKEWEKIKPKIEQDSKVNDYRVLKNVKKKLAEDKNANALTKSALLKKGKIESPPPLKPYSSVRKMIKCPNCNTPVLPKNLQKHKKKCKRSNKKGKTASLNKDPISNNTSFTKSNNDAEERRLYGSHGYHIRRENGRFGSQPLYDNMNDESVP